MSLHSFLSYKSFIYLSLFVINQITCPLECAAFWNLVDCFFLVLFSFFKKIFLCIFNKLSNYSRCSIAFRFFQSKNNAQPLIHLVISFYYEEIMLNYWMLRLIIELVLPLCTCISFLSKQYMVKIYNYTEQRSYMVLPFLSSTLPALFPVQV